MNVLETARHYRACGLSVLPIRPDGSKKPNVDGWLDLIETPASDDRLVDWFSDEVNGIGIIGGAVSGGLEIIDLETKEIAITWRELVCSTPEGAELFDSLLVIKSPRGFHCYYRCDQPQRSQDLARRPSTVEELAQKPDQKYRKLIETRGDRGYVVAPGSPVECHPTHIPYQVNVGDYEHIPYIAMEQRDFLLECARSLNEYVREDDYHEPEKPRVTGEIGNRPGDIFKAVATWAEILEPHGWTKGKGKGRWARPGSSRDSAIEIGDDREYLWVFSTSVAELPFEKATDKFAAYAFLNCGGDFSKASRDLAFKGYCAEKHEESPPEPDPDPQIQIDFTPPAEEQSESEESEEEEYSVREWPKLAPEAYHGLAGRFLEVATVSSEADPAAILAAFLVRAGASFGSNHFIRVSDDHHYPRLFALVVGASSKSRKGTSLGPVKRLFAAAEAHLKDFELRIVSGLSSGEGLIVAADSNQGKEEEEGSADKRLMVIETEFAGPLKAMQRDGNNLSSVLRNAWDREDLSITTRNNPVFAKNVHINVLGQITKAELGRLLEKVEISNGLINRFLCFAVRRAKILSFPEGLADNVIPPLAAELAECIRHAQAKKRLYFHHTAAECWREVYVQLQKESGGVIDEVTARGDSHVLRLALLYALLDRDDMVRLPHLQAAIAVWEFCLASSRMIFESAIEKANSKAENSLKEQVLKLLQAGKKTQKDLCFALRHKCKSAELVHVLAELQSLGRISQEVVKPPVGRPITNWSLREGTNGAT